MHFARFSLSLQHDVRNTIMDEIEKNNQIVAQPATQSLIQDLRQIIGKKSGTVLMIHKKLWYLCTESTR